MNKYDDDDCPCNSCEYKCDDLEAQYCYDFRKWLDGGEEYDCDDCDPMNI